MVDTPIRLSPVNHAWLAELAHAQFDGDVSAALDHLITAARLATDRHYEVTGKTGSPHDAWALIDAELDDHNRNR